MFPLPVGVTCPIPPPDSPVTVEVLSAGQVTSKARTVLDDGSRGAIEMPLLVGVLRHPDGALLVDAGLGQTTRDRDFPRWPLRLLDLEVPPGQSILEQLGGPPDRVLMTHLHYDHIGGLFDMPGVETWTTSPDWSAYARGNVHFPPRLRSLVDWVVPSMRETALGQPAADVMGDGTIWYVATPGHTPGSASVLVYAADGPWLFVGDTAWLDAHLEGAWRPKRTSRLVDADRDALEASLAWARGLHAACPDLKVVAGHEPRWAP